MPVSPMQQVMMMMKRMMMSHDDDDRHHVSNYHLPLHLIHDGARHFVSAVVFVQEDGRDVEEEALTATGILIAGMCVCAAPPTCRCDSWP